MDTIRHIKQKQNFITKVYLILTLQLLITTAVVWLNLKVKYFARFQAQSTWAHWAALIGAALCLKALSFGKITMNFPLNFTVVIIFTLCESYLVAFFCSFYPVSNILLAVQVSLIANIGLIYYSMITKEIGNPFNFVCKGILYLLSWITLSASFINIIFLKGSQTSLMISILIALAYSAYILIDTQSIIKSKIKKQEQLKDYVMGATTIYTDIITSFVNLLQFVAKLNEPVEKKNQNVQPVVDDRKKA